jgi:hypothetical protein
MGFSSFTSALSGKDIYNVHREDKHEGISIVFPDNSFIFGDYDGYGGIQTGVTKDSLFNIWVLAAIDGDLETYMSLDEKTHEELRSKAITEFYEDRLTIKVMTAQEMVDLGSSLIEYDDLKPSLSAKSQGYWDE